MKQSLTMSLNFLRKHFGDFLNSLNTVQQFVFWVGMVGLPIYIIKAQLFVLLGYIGALIRGNDIDMLSFIMILTETGLLFYTIMMYVDYHSAVQLKANDKKTRFTGVHFSVEFSQVSNHLLRPPAPVESKSSPYNGMANQYDEIDEEPAPLSADAYSALLEQLSEQSGHISYDSEVVEEVATIKSFADILRESEENESFDTIDDMIDLINK